jgi:hypothetical protein
MRFRLVILLSCCALLGGCRKLSLGGKPKGAVRPSIVGFSQPGFEPRAPKLAGRIAMVSSDAKFVLIESDAWSIPPEGTALKCLRYGAETAVLTISKERRGNYIAADIVKGAPQRGDEVYH